MTTVREARVESSLRAIQETERRLGHDLRNIDLAEAVVDALFTADKLIDNATIAQAWGLTTEDLEKVNYRNPDKCSPVCPACASPSRFRGLT
jgi:hypothetical protein